MSDGEDFDPDEHAQDVAIVGHVFPVYGDPWAIDLGMLKHLRIEAERVMLWKNGQGEDEAEKAVRREAKRMRREARKAGMFLNG